MLPSWNEHDVSFLVMTAGMSTISVSEVIPVGVSTTLVFRLNPAGISSMLVLRLFQLE